MGQLVHLPEPEVPGASEVKSRLRPASSSSRGPRPGGASQELLDLPLPLPPPSLPPPGTPRDVQLYCGKTRQDRQSDRQQQQRRRRQHWARAGSRGCMRCGCLERTERTDWLTLLVWSVPTIRRPNQTILLYTYTHQQEEGEEGVWGDGGGGAAAFSFLLNRAYSFLPRLIHWHPEPTAWATLGGRGGEKRWGERVRLSWTSLYLAPSMSFLCLAPFWRILFWLWG